MITVDELSKKIFRYYEQTETVRMLDITHGRLNALPISGGVRHSSDHKVSQRLAWLAHNVMKLDGIVYSWYFCDPSLCVALFNSATKKFRPIERIVAVNKHSDTRKTFEDTRIEVVDTPDDDV